MRSTDRSDADGVSFALLHRSRLDPFVNHFAKARRAIVGASVALVLREALRAIGHAARPEDDKHRLNAHASSAVPFNGLFPHS